MQAKKFNYFYKKIFNKPKSDKEVEIFFFVQGISTYKDRKLHSISSGKKYIRLFKKEMDNFCFIKFQYRA